LDFVIDDKTVPNLTFKKVPSDPHPSKPHYKKYSNRNTYIGAGAGTEIGEGVEVHSAIHPVFRPVPIWLEL